MVASTDARFRKGDAVLATSYDLGVAHDGGYAEYARVPADWVVPLPKGMTLFEAMALGTAGYTAGLAVVRMEHNGLKPANGPVIVDGATGGVGSIAIDIAGEARVSRGRAHRQGERGRLAEGARRQGSACCASSLDLTKIKPLDKATWAGRGGQPRRRGAGLAGEHHEDQRHDRQHRPGGRPSTSTPR